MTKLAIVAVAIATLSACAQMRDSSSQSSAAGGGSYAADAQHPEWLQDPARGDFPYSGNGW
jgi:hypothetical protein